MLPKFGDFNDQETSFEKLMTEFQIEFYWFKKQSEKQSDVVNIRILHICTNLEQSQSEMKKIKIRLENIGFNQFEYEKYDDQKIRDKWIGGDLILYGTDDAHFASVMKCIRDTYGLFTAYPKIGILVYSTSPNITDFLDLTQLEIYTGPQFSEGAIFLLYNKIRYNQEFRDAMALYGLNNIERIIVKLCPDCKSFCSKKIRNKFKTYCDKKITSHVMLICFLGL